MFITYMGPLGYQTQIQSLETDFIFLAVSFSYHQVKKESTSCFFSELAVEYFIFPSATGWKQYKL